LYLIGTHFISQSKSSPNGDGEIVKSFTTSAPVWVDYINDSDIGINIGAGTGVRVDLFWNIARMVRDGTGVSIDDDGLDGNFVWQQYQQNIGRRRTEREVFIHGH